MIILLGFSQRRKQNRALVIHTGVYKAHTGHHLPWGDALWKLLAASPKQQTAQRTAGENRNSEEPSDSYKTVSQLVTGSNPDLLTCSLKLVHSHVSEDISQMNGEHAGQLLGRGLGQRTFKKQIVFPGTEQIRSLSVSQSPSSPARNPLFRGCKQRH